MDVPYKYFLTISYSNNEEYRQCLRNLFSMVPKIDKDLNLDPISEDEYNYDEESAAKALDFLDEKTKNHPLFIKLYQKAAEKMLSHDISIGLSVLCSYDYLYLFHLCIREFIESPSTFQEHSQSFQGLYKIIS